MDFSTADPDTLRRMLNSRCFGAAAEERIRARLDELVDQVESHAGQEDISREIPPPQPTARRGRRNQTEERFARDILDPLVASGELVRYEFEAITFHVHDVAKYTPDYIGWTPDERIRAYEVKGAHIRQKDLIRWKAHSRERRWISWSIWQWKDRRWTLVHNRPRTDGGADG